MFSNGWMSVRLKSVVALLPFHLIQWLRKRRKEHFLRFQSIDLGAVNSKFIQRSAGRREPPWTRLKEFLSMIQTRVKFNGTPIYQYEGILKWSALSATPTLFSSFWLLHFFHHSSAADRSQCISLFLVNFTCLCTQLLWPLLLLNLSLVHLHLHFWKSISKSSQ